MEPQTLYPHRDRPTVLVIFGVTGDLSSRKLLPALYQLLKYNHLPYRMSVVGVFREGSSSLDEVMQQTEIQLLRTKKECDPAILQRLRDMIRPITMDSTKREDYAVLRAELEAINQEFGVSHQWLFYLAIPPVIFRDVVGALAAAGLNRETDGVARRIFVEKPFGSDTASARDLIDFMGQHFDEHQIYRIDHYLAKETAQNILTFRFNNPLIEDIWGRQYIDHIQISALETIGVLGRGAFYEPLGALRDIVQSHLLQLLALVLMEVPDNLDGPAVHTEKLALLQSVQVTPPGHVDESSVFGQYDGYAAEVGNPESRTETYCALKLDVASSRWGGVPILLRTGKSLTTRRTDIKIVFKDRSRRGSPDNILTIRLRPDEGINLRLMAKRPGFDDSVAPVDMTFRYESSFEGNHPDAYDRVLTDAIAGDQTLFASSEEVMRCWEILEPFLQARSDNAAPPERYPIGSHGPASADQLAERFGTTWLE